MPLLNLNSIVNDRPLSILLGSEGPFLIDLAFVQNNCDDCNRN